MRVVDRSTPGTPRHAVLVAAVLLSQWLLVGSHDAAPAHGHREEAPLLDARFAEEGSTVEIPFQSQEEIERSMSAIKWRILREKVEGLLPLGRD